jgi:hypothetical protein
MNIESILAAGWVTAADLGPAEYEQALSSGRPGASTTRICTRYAMRPLP